ncbi:uncharacterized protein METZ01_LOCUS383589 [marine metagenome]|uniref:Uncharacterized protein n=1 Tax=marine metagenome TaxID=408172 RepID=A0A382UA34_9ZZZZ
MLLRLLELALAYKSNIVMTLPII